MRDRAWIYCLHCGRLTLHQLIPAASLRDRDRYKCPGCGKVVCLTTDEGYYKLYD